MGTKSDRTAMGYRQHTAMIRFAWHKDTVHKRIRKLNRSKDRKSAKEALRYLLACNESSYKKFYDGHLSFLAKNPRASGEMRKRPMAYLTQPGLECAVWPNLFWKTTMCMTWERETNSGKLVPEGQDPGAEVDMEEYDRPGVWKFALADTTSEEEEKKEEEAQVQRKNALEESSSSSGSISSQQSAV